MSYDNRPAGCERTGNWLQTFTGAAFWPLDPRPEEVSVEDIAHALGNLCRYGGHTSKFYSVAEHCVWVSLYVPREYAMEGLMHDATEAYLVDVPRPIKYNLANYREIEGNLERVIAEKFGLPAVMSPEVKRVDNDILHDEAIHLLKPHPLPWGIGGEPIGLPYLGCWSPEVAKHMFLERFHELGGNNG